MHNVLASGKYIVIKFCEVSSDSGPKICGIFSEINFGLPSPKSKVIFVRDKSLFGGSFCFSLCSQDSSKIHIQVSAIRMSDCKIRLRAAVFTKLTAVWHNFEELIH